MFGKRKTKKSLEIGDKIRVINHGMSGVEENEWTVGEERDKETIERYYDWKRKVLYMMTYREDGKEKSRVLGRKGWEMLEKALGRRLL